MKLLSLALLVLATAIGVSQIPSAPPHSDSSERFKKAWVFDAIKGCHKQQWHDADKTRDSFCHETAAALADLYLDEHPELLK